MDNKKSLDNPDKMNAWKLILLKENPKIEDIYSIYEKAIKFARNYMDYVARYWAMHNPTKVIDKVFKMSIDEWCIIFRELLYIYLNAECFNTTSQKGDTVERTLMAVVKSLNSNKIKNTKSHNKQPEKRHERENKQESHSNMALLKRLNNRMLMIFSSPEAAEYQFEIEKHILRIEEKVLSYQTIEDVRRANSIMGFAVALNSEGEEFIDLTHMQLEYALWNKSRETECNNFKLLYESMCNAHTFKEHETIKQLLSFRLSRGEYWKYTIQFNNEMIRHDFLNAISRDSEYIGVYNVQQELTEEYTPKPIIAMYKINNIFYLCMNDDTSNYDVQTYSFSIPLFFQEGYNHKMKFSFDIDHINKIITIISCSFDDDVQKVFNMRKNVVLEITYNSEK